MYQHHDGGYTAKYGSEIKSSNEFMDIRHELIFIFFYGILNMWQLCCRKEEHKLWRNDDETKFLFTTKLIATYSFFIKYVKVILYYISYSWISYHKIWRQDTWAAAYYICLSNGYLEKETCLRKLQFFLKYVCNILTDFIQNP